MMNVLSAALAAVILVVAVAPLQALAQTKGKITQQGFAQINAIIAEKQSRNLAQKKIGSRLLYGARKKLGRTPVPGAPQLRTNIDVDARNRVLVDIKADVSPDLEDAIVAFGGEVVSSHARFSAIRAWLPLDRIESLGWRDDIKSIRQASRAITNMSNVSEGDIAHRADLTRSNLSVDGAGITVGVLSDAVDELAVLQGSDDIPPTCGTSPCIEVLSGQAGSGGSEGTAMLEIVHDLAPGADLMFATAFGGQAQFAQNILDLRAAGADVIVDDIFYFSEPVFQDGIIAQAVTDVVKDGALYFSSAGNAGNLNDGTSGVYEGDYVGTALPAPLVGAGLTAHNFGGGVTGNIIAVDSPFAFTLQWSDPFGASANDYDLFLLNSLGDTVFASSVNEQNGDDDPFEIIDSNGFNDTGNLLVIVKFLGDDRFFHLNTLRGELTVATDGQTAGHGAAEYAFGVAAVDAAPLSGVMPFDSGDVVETFSSDGPRRIFYDEMGNALTPGNVSSSGGQLLQKPDITAADGVATATTGFNPFFGTSAAAPHAAAIAALLLQPHPGLSRPGAAALFNNTAIDIEAVGPDRDSGAGIVDALTSSQAMIFADGFNANDLSAWTATFP